MILHPTQRIVASDNHRFRVCCNGRRWGKTTLAIEEIKGRAVFKRSHIAYIANTYSQAREISWELMKKEYAPIIIDRNEQRLEIKVRTLDGGESIIVLKGWESIETLRGQSFDFIVIDEVASMKNFQASWQAVIRPTLSDRQGEVLFISTPQGFNSFYDIFNQELKDKDYKSFHFTTFDNPYISKAEIEKAQKEMTADYFEQEYMANFKRSTGLVFKEFDRSIHVIDPIDLPDAWTYYRTMDFGAVDPTVCLWVAVDHLDNIYVFDEYYNTGQTTRFNAEFINTKTRHRISQTFGDPSGNQEMLDYASFGLIISPAVRMYTQNQDWVNSGIQRVRELMKPDAQTGKSKFKVFKTCTNLIRDIESYAWKESKDNSREVPEHQFSHGNDSLRYMAVSYNVQNMQQFVYEEPMKTNLYTGY